MAPMHRRNIRIKPPRGYQESDFQDAIDELKNNSVQLVAGPVDLHFLFKDVVIEKDGRRFSVDFMSSGEENYINIEELKSDHRMKFVALILVLISFLSTNASLADGAVSKVVAARFMSENCIVIGKSVPTIGMRYILFGTVPLQKIGDGYLLTNNPAFMTVLTTDDDHVVPIYLYTRRSVSERYMFGRDDLGEFVGYFEYKGLDGFDKKVFAFRLVE